MITNRERSIIVGLAKKYNIVRVLLFGSAAKKDGDYCDIDLAVAGLAPGRFFAFYGELLLGLTKPVDFIDLESRSRFVQLVEEEGVPIYG